MNDRVLFITPRRPGHRVREDERELPAGVLDEPSGVVPQERKRQTHNTPPIALARVGADLVHKLVAVILLIEPYTCPVGILLLLIASHTFVLRANHFENCL